MRRVLTNFCTALQSSDPARLVQVVTMMASAIGVSSTIQDMDEMFRQAEIVQASVSQKSEMSFDQLGPFGVLVNTIIENGYGRQRVTVSPPVDLAPVAWVLWRRYFTQLEMGTWLREWKIATFTITDDESEAPLDISMTLWRRAVRWWERMIDAATPNANDP